MITIKELLDHVLEGLARNELDLGNVVNIRQGEKEFLLEKMSSSDTNELILNLKEEIKDD